MNLPVKVLTKVGGGGRGGARVGVDTRVIVEYEQKGDQAKSTALEIYFFYNSVEVEHKKLKFRFLLHQLR